MVKPSRVERAVLLVASLVSLILLILFIIFRDDSSGPIFLVGACVLVATDLVVAMRIVVKSSRKSQSSTSGS